VEEHQLPVPVVCQKAQQTGDGDVLGVNGDGRGGGFKFPVVGSAYLL